MDHEKIRKSLALYHDGELPPDQRRTLEAHLEGCPQCRDRLQELRGVARVFSAVLESEPSEAFVTRVMEDLGTLPEREPAPSGAAPAHWLVPALAFGMAAGLFLLSLPDTKTPVSTEELLLADSRESASSGWMLRAETPEDDDLLRFALEEE